MARARNGKTRAEAPEHLFPAAFEDTAAALQWIVSHGPGSPIEPAAATDVFVCGDSAGGGLAVAAAACLGPSERSVRCVLRGVVGLSAWMDMTASASSYATRSWDPARGVGDAVNPGVSQKDGQEEAEVYLGPSGVAKHGRDPRVSPVFAKPASLARMPPTLLQVGDYEVILDESLELAGKMKGCGSQDVTVSVYPRMWHCWQEYTEGGGLNQPLAAARRAIREVGRWVKHRLA